MICAMLSPSFLSPFPSPICSEDASLRSRHYVAGNGEVGSAIAETLSGEYDVEVFGKAGTSGTCDVLHVCFPHSDTFEAQVEDAALRYAPNLTIIHSTVPVGTTDSLATTLRVVHSPVRGVHPHLVEGVRTFVKYFAGNE